MKDYYKILGVPKNATKDEIKKAYYKLSNQYHPDKGGDERIFSGIHDAYEELTNNFGNTYESKKENNNTTSNNKNYYNNQENYNNRNSKLSDKNKRTFIIVGIIGFIILIRAFTGSSNDTATNSNINNSSTSLSENSKSTSTSSNDVRPINTDGDYFSQLQNELKNSSNQNNVDSLDTLQVINKGVNTVKGTYDQAKYNIYGASIVLYKGNQTNYLLLHPNSFDINSNPSYISMDASDHGGGFDFSNGNFFDKYIYNSIDNGTYTIAIYPVETIYNSGGFQGYANTKLIFFKIVDVDKSSNFNNGY